MGSDTRPSRRRRFTAEGHREESCQLSAISRRPKSEHRLAFWRTRWRSSAHAGVLAHRLASSAAGKIHRRDAEHAENREIEVEERGLVAINYRSEKRRSFFLPTADSLFLRGPLRPSAVNLRLLPAWLRRSPDGIGTTPRLVGRSEDRGFASLSPSHPEAGYRLSARTRVGLFVRPTAIFASLSPSHPEIAGSPLPES